MNVPATAAAALSVLLFVIALAAMTNGSLRVAGVSFLSASIVIYLRETMLTES
ncbi:hypothetical protein [Haladaptatus sp. CMAA 1911]|uniref:hypothetical protein n=1 Tax=unclassified Haladaptatus TaxID=2622732 RepID=UPI0037548526